MTVKEKTYPVAAKCTQCGSEFQRRADFVARSATQFCTLACYHAWQKGQPKSVAHRKAISLANKGKNFKGNLVQPHTGRWRARHLYQIQPCEVCGATVDQRRIERHHKDGNPLNNQPLNIAFLCVPHHRQADALRRQAGH